MSILIAPATLATAIVTLLATLLYMYMSINVGRMRGKTQIAAPAMTGHPDLERAVRVHYNTLESLPIFFAALWLATIYFHPLAIPFSGWIAPLVGLVWIVGRVLYLQGYMAAPDKRSTGFGIAALALIVLIVLAFVGIVIAWMATSAT
ncbi:MAG TPA: MAPEG family protein [Rhizomicrobium sp.]|jgi:glutathione S-transferase